MINLEILTNLLFTPSSKVYLIFNLPLFWRRLWSWSYDSYTYLVSNNGYELAWWKFIHKVAFEVLNLLSIVSFLEHRIDTAAVGLSVLSSTITKKSHWFYFLVLVCFCELRMYYHVRFVNKRQLFYYVCNVFISSTS